MAAVRSDRIGVPSGLHERRMLAWISLLGDVVEEDRADRDGGTVQARPVVAAR